MFSLYGVMLISMLIAKPGDSDGKSFDSSLFSGSVYSGFGMSIFDEDLLDYYYLDDGFYIPAGVKFMYQASSRFSVGTEFELSLLPFACEGDFSQNGYAWESEAKVSLTTIGIVGQLYVSDNLYFRAGLGRYAGSAEIEITSGTYIGYYGDTDIEPAFGFNAGLGYETPISEKAFAGVEAVYHSVKCELEEFEYDVDDLDFNHWAARVFIGMSF